MRRALSLLLEVKTVLRGDVCRRWQKKSSRFSWKRETRSALCFSAAISCPLSARKTVGQEHRDGGSFFFCHWLREHLWVWFSALASAFSGIENLANSLRILEMYIQESCSYFQVPLCPDSSMPWVPNTPRSFCLKSDVWFVPGRRTPSLIDWSGEFWVNDVFISHSKHLSEVNWQTELELFGFDFFLLIRQPLLKVKCCRAEV